jgi:hypothetical protein
MIVASAIRQSGRIFTGTRHNECIGQMIALGYQLPIKGEQGFVDDAGNFLTRHEAGEHAIKCGQIDHMRWPGMGLDSVEVFPREPSPKAKE